jgi:hypothetical protein
VASVLVVSGVFVAAVAMMAASFRLLDGKLATSAGLFPLIVSAAMIVVSALILIGDVRRLRHSEVSGSVHEAPAPETLTGERAQFKLLAGWIALASAYAIATPLVGFEVATFVMLTAALKVFGKASWPIVLTVPIAVALILPFVFRYVFHTLIP